METPDDVRLLRLALAHGYGFAYQGLDAISSELETLFRELLTISVNSVGVGSAP